MFMPPKKIKVLGQTIKIVVKDMEDLGEFDRSKLTISLSRSQTPDEMASSLLHEILHAVFFISGHSFIIEDNHEEALVRVLETGLYEHIKLSL